MVDGAAFLDQVLDQDEKMQLEDDNQDKIWSSPMMFFHKQCVNLKGTHGTGQYHGDLQAQ
jgi:hypothetical protein